MNTMSPNNYDWLIERIVHIETINDTGLHSTPHSNLLSHYHKGDKMNPSTQPEPNEVKTGLSISYHECELNGESYVIMTKTDFLILENRSERLNMLATLFDPGLPLGVEGDSDNPWEV